MPRRPFIHLAGNLSGWPKGTVPTPGLMRKMDQFSSELVNGEDGGEYEPETPIVIGPYASPTITFSSTGCGLRGKVETVKGNSRDETVDKAGLVLTGGNFPTFQTARTRKVVVSLGLHIEQRSSSAANDPKFELDPLTFGARRILTNDNTDIVSVPLPIRAQHSGVTIDSVVFRYRINSQRSALPTSMPKFRVVKVSADTIAPLNSGTSTPFDSNGWYEDQAGTASAYYNNGQTRTATYTCNQNNTSLAQSNAYWMVMIRDEGGGNNFVGNVYLSAVVNLSAIADYRPEYG